MSCYFISSGKRTVCIAIVLSRYTRRLRLTVKIGLASIAVERGYLIAGAVVVENLQHMRTIHSQNEFNKPNLILRINKHIGARFSTERG